MITLGELRTLLHVEEGHTSNFEKWGEKATDPLAKLVFRMAADKEANHIRWVKLLIEFATSGKQSGDPGVSESELEFWMADEAGEADHYDKMASSVEEPWVAAALKQMGQDERTNADMLESLLRAIRAEA